MRVATHGGDIDAVARDYGVDASTLIDFSANVAPDGPPRDVASVLREMAQHPRALSPYPAASYRELREQIAHMLDVDAASVVVGHGGPALLDLALRVSAADSWLVPVPAFSEYRRALDAARMPMQAFVLPLSMEFDPGEFSIRLAGVDGAGALINTPHNPSGSAPDRDGVLALLERCEAMARPLIVDEAFIDYEPERSIVREVVRSRRAIVLRSLTKFYALAGVRVAYALTHPDLARAMQASSPSWPVGTLDAAIALAALRDKAYATRTREQNASARDQLATALAASGMTVLPSAANFLCVELPVPVQCLDDVLQAMVQNGIVVRDCRSYEGLEQRGVIRIAVLDGKRNQRLVTALSGALESIHAHRH
jgi:threonine-phosphate decarboxylase